MSVAANLPPLPGTEDPDTPKPSFTAYILRGQQWVEIGVATPHPDGKGHQLCLDIAPEDGDVIELRALEPRHYPAGEGRGRAPKSRRARSSKPRIGAFRD